MHTRFYKSHLGFTLWEIIISLSLLSIIAAISYPVVGHISSSFLQKEAITRARILNCAKESYRIRIGENNRIYADVDDNTRFRLLLPYMSQGARTLDEFTPKGFVIALDPNIEIPACIWDLQGRRIDY